MSTTVENTQTNMQSTMDTELNTTQSNTDRSIHTIDYNGKTLRYPYSQIKDNLFLEAKEEYEAKLCSFVYTEEYR